MFYLPLSLFYFISLLLLHNFIIFPPHSWIPSLSTIFIIFPPPPQLYYFPSSTSSFILHIFPSTNTSTSNRPYIDPTSTPHRPHIDPLPTLLSTFFNTASWIVKLYTTTTTTTTTFLLFSLHHHHHHRHRISIVFPPPGGGGGKTIGSRLLEAIMAGTYSLKRFLKKTPVTEKLKNK